MRDSLADLPSKPGSRPSGAVCVPQRAKVKEFVRHDAGEIGTAKVQAHSKQNSMGAPHLNVVRSNSAHRPCPDGPARIDKNPRGFAVESDCLCR